MVCEEHGRSQLLCVDRDKDSEGERGQDEKEGAQVGGVVVPLFQLMHTICRSIRDDIEEEDDQVSLSVLLPVTLPVAILLPMSLVSRYSIPVLLPMSCYCHVLLGASHQ